MADFVITPDPGLDLPELLRPPSAYRTVIERKFASTRTVPAPAGLPAMSVSTQDAVYLLADLTSVDSHETADVVIEIEGESLTVPPRAVSWLADTLRALIRQIHRESALEERRRVFAAAAGGAAQ